MEQKNTQRIGIVLFVFLISAASIGDGLGDTVFSNYFREVYQATATQRAFIEFPRELPGLLCALVIALLSLLGDLRISLIAQLLSCAGLMVLGIFTPSYGVMLIFIFISSMGMHLFLPLRDSIAMSLSEPDMVGRRIGQYNSTRIGAQFVAGIIVFWGFKSGAFSFASPIKYVFLLGSFAYLVAAVSSLLLVRHAPKTVPVRKTMRLCFRKEYRYFYFLTILNGVQKQIALVFGSWVIVDLFRKGAETMSLLIIISSLLGVFFMRMIGKWMDQYGIKRMMYVDALTFIGVYVLYGLTVSAITSARLPQVGWPVFIIYVLFVMDRLSMNVGVVKSVYMHSIAINKEEVTATLATGTSLDHIVAIIAAQFSGFIWVTWGPQWVFFMAAFFSLGNLFVAWKLPRDCNKMETA